MTFDLSFLNASKKEELVGYLNSYTKSILEIKYYKMVSKNLNPKFLEALEKQGVNSEFLTLLKSNLLPVKIEMIHFIIFVFYKKELFLPFYEGLQSYIQKALEHLIKNELLNELEMSVLLGQKCYRDEKSTYRTFRTLNDEFTFLTSTEYSEKYYYDTNKELFEMQLSKIWYNALLISLPKPSNASLIYVNEAEIKGKIYLSENFVFKDFPKVLAYYLQGNIKYSARLKPNNGGLKKMIKQTNLQEYYEIDNEIGTLKSYLLALAMRNMPRNLLAKPIIEQVKYCYLNCLLGSYSMKEYLLSNLRGFHQLFQNDYTNVEKQLLEQLTQINPNNWIAIDNFLVYSKYEGIDYMPVINNYALRSNIYYEETVLHSYYESKERKYVKNNKEKLLKIPYLKGMLWYLSVLGCVDIAYQNIDSTQFGSTYFSNFDGLTHFKVNKFGAYLLGIDKTYTSEVQEIGGKLHFSEDSLIIFADGDVSLYDVLLNNFTEKISENRYRLSSAVFLKDCKSEKQVIDKINMFKDTIGVALPANWSNYFLEIIENFKAIKGSIEYYIMNVKPNDTALLKILAQDAEIKNMIIKAEKYHIMVQKSNYLSFRNRLMYFGYFLPL